MSSAVTSNQPHTIDSADITQVELPPPDVPTSDVAPESPLSFAQERLWFLHQIEPGSAAYNVPVALRLRGALRPDILRRALLAIVERHEILRTRYRLKNGIVVQECAATTNLDFEMVDFNAKCGEYHDDHSDAQMHAWLFEESRRPFRISNGEVMRVRLGKLRPSDHLLLIVLHHIAADEWSLKVLLDELSANYRSLMAGKPVNAPPLPIQYADYAEWQREWLSGEQLESHARYWREQLRRDLPRLDLPFDFKPKTTSTANGGVESRVIRWSDEIDAVAAQHRATPFMLLLAIFKVLLARYTRQDQIAVGSPISGRTRVETEPLIGFFVNTLVLNTDLSGNPTFADVLARVRETALGAFAHQEMPFEKLVQEFRPDRGPGKVPLIQTMFAFETIGEHRVDLPELDAQWVDVHTGAAKLDWTVVARRSPSGLVLTIEYNRELFRPETAQRMLGHFEMLLESSVRDPNTPISRLRLLTDDERRRAIVDWNDTATEYPNQSTIAALFERQAACRPDAVAAIYVRNTGVALGGDAPGLHEDENEQITYDRLNRRANRLAHELRANRIGPGTKVGLCIERSVDMIAAMIGILKAGAAYVPLDPSYPDDRLAFMIADTKAPLIVTTRTVSSRFIGHKAQVVCLDDLSEELPDCNPPAAGSAADLAYVIYTSGSTGQPKGVLVPNRAVVRLVCGTDYVRLKSDDRVAQVSNANFDAATFEVWGALLNGATVLGFSQDVTLSPKRFACQLAAHRVTTLFLTTALFNQLAREAPEAFRALRHLLFGGELVDPKWVSHVLNGHRPERLLHVYGPTETTTFATWFEVRSAAREESTVPIGRPIANTRVYLLDERMEPVPVGVPGEIYIGGDGLAHGYLNQKQATAERFAPDPFSDVPGAKLYRTGDLARYRFDGSIEFIGRTDHQVKVRGFRVELGEIEATLTAHSGIREAVVVALPEESSGSLKLVAYVVFKGEPIALEELRQFIRAKLPEYMAPSQFVPLSELPLNANGKVDRSQLPAPDSARSMLMRKHEPARNEVERRLTRIFESVLGTAGVGVTDNFFELGGHSLLAVRLFGNIEREFETQLPLATLFQAPTIEQLAPLISKEELRRPKSLFVAIQPEGSKRPLFWIHSLGGDGGGAFFYYRKLAALLGQDQPSFGIRSPEEPFTRIEEMAAHYIRELIAFQPQGPYLLGGFCFGGNVAYEMARQLMESGREVGLLVLLESAAPVRANGTGFLNRDTIGPFLAHLRSWLAEFLHLSPDELLTRLRQKQKSVAKLLHRALAFGSSEPGEIALNEVLNMTDYPADYVKYAKAHWEALLHYVPQSYEGRVTLFRARKQPLSRYDPTLGWGGLAKGGVAVNVVPGSHEKMLDEPNVQVLASELRACLAEAHTEHFLPRQERQ